MKVAMIPSTREVTSAFSFTFRTLSTYYYGASFLLHSPQNGTAPRTEKG